MYDTLFPNSEDDVRSYECNCAALKIECMKKNINHDVIRQLHKLTHPQKENKCDSLSHVTKRLDVTRYE